MLRIAIVGCGKIADSHAEQIQRVADCSIVGVCDKEMLMARQLYERFRVGAYFDDVNELLAQSKPDVVHITTPPQSHFELGRLCLQSGCHVYIEKPFALDAKETEELIRLAGRNGLKVTAGHDYQFSNAARRMRQLLRRGYIGAPPYHMESYYCYNLGDENYARAFLGDRYHWVRCLPGRLLHNIISHGIAKIAEHLDGDRAEVVASGFSSRFIEHIGEPDIIDELRVIIADAQRNTAYFTFSTQMRPILNQFRIYGSRNGLIADHDHQTLIKLRGTKYKSYLDKFIPPYGFAGQYIGNAFYNTKCFLKNDFHMNAGMKYLIERFYRAIEGKAALPIPDREIILTARIMDSIFEQIYFKNEMAAEGSFESTGGCRRRVPLYHGFAKNSIQLSVRGKMQ